MSFIKLEQRILIWVLVSKLESLCFAHFLNPTRKIINFHHLNIFFNRMATSQLKKKKLQMTLLQTILVKVVVLSTPLSSILSDSGYLLLRTSQSHKGVFHIYPETSLNVFFSSFFLKHFQCSRYNVHLNPLIYLISSFNCDGKSY